MAHPADATRPGGRRRRNPQATRDRLVRAALDLFTTQGYHASTTPQLAQKAGVAEGTIYRHFESKEHLLNELYRAAVRLLLSFIKEAPGSAPCQDRLQTIAGHWRDLAERDPALVKLVFLTEHGALLDQRSHAAMAELKGTLANVIASGKAAGDVRAGAVEIWTDVWMQLVALAMERIATGKWTVQHVGTRQVTQAAWDAIRVSDSAPEGARTELAGDDLPDPQR